MMLNRNHAFDQTNQDRFELQIVNVFASFKCPFIVMLISGIGMQPYFCEIIIDKSVQRQSLSIRYRSKSTWWFESIVMSIVCLRSFIRNHRVHTSLQYTDRHCYLREARVTISRSFGRKLRCASFAPHSLNVKLPTRLAG